jgi:hypothetical protein
MLSIGLGAEMRLSLARLGCDPFELLVIKAFGYGAGVCGVLLQVGKITAITPYAQGPIRTGVFSSCVLGSFP